MTPDTVMIFAAGLGTRMGALTRDCPKPLIKVAGRPLIDHALDLVQAAGLGRTVINLHYKGDMLRAHLAGRDIAFSDEGAALLETGGGLRHALPLIGPEPVFTLNSDAVWRGRNPFTALSAAWWPGRMEALLLLLPTANALGHTGTGDFLRGDDGRLCRGPGLVYSGLQIIRTDTLHDVPHDAFSLNVIWNAMAARGTLFGLPYDGQWCDVGHPQSLPLAERLLHDADVS